jgi:elongation factor P
MLMSNQISPGMTIKLDGRIYRVEASVKVTLAKANPFIKTKLRDLVNDKVIEKNFKLNQPIEEVALIEHQLEYLYPEGKKHLFLDVGNLEQVMVAPEILANAVNFMKEGTQLKAMFYGDTIFSVELPQFLELMIVKTEAVDEKIKMANMTKKATLETGAEIQVPLFIEVGDIVKVDVYQNEYIQRI